MPGSILVEDAIVADGKTIIVGDPLLTDVARYYSKRPELLCDVPVRRQQVFWPLGMTRASMGVPAE
jgi:hypothetical protein